MVRCVPLPSGAATNNPLEEDMQQKNMVTEISLTLRRAAEITGYSETRIRQAVASGRLKSWRVGKRRMTKPAYVQEMIDADERDSLGKAA